MHSEKQILCVIPARSGSKRLPGKNTKLLAGKPLIAYAIEAAIRSKYLDKVIVSTDSDEIATISRQYGAEVPFYRPENLATDESSVIPVIQHAVKFYENRGERIDCVVMLQPTTPGVVSEDVDKVVEKLMESGANSSTTVSEITDRPEYMYTVDSSNKWKPFVGGSQQRSQVMQRLYRLNGAVFATHRDFLINENKLYDDENGVAVIMPKERSIDIDTEFDFIAAETFMSILHDK